MTQVDLETLVSACAGGNSTKERKIACEEAFSDGDDSKGRNEDCEEPDQREVPPDFPPESFWLSKDAEHDWFDRNAFFERKESTKGNTNSMNTNPNANPSSNSNSQRFSSNFKSKPSIIGLPKLQKTSFVDAKNRRACKPGNARWFPKRSGSVAKSDSSLLDPSSPKVSCMGRVKSKRDRNRRRKNGHKPSETAEGEEKSAKKKGEEKSAKKKTKQSFFKNFVAIFQSSCKRQPAVEQSALVAISPPRKSPASKAPAKESLPRESTESEPPSLGGMNRFASGRRSAAWGVVEPE